MFTTIAFVTILSAILVFFVDEISGYAKALMAKPYVFMAFGLLVLTTYIEIYHDFVLWLVISIWIALLLSVQFLSDHLLGNFADQFLPKWILAVILPVIPIAVALQIDARKRKRSSYNQDVIKKRGYVIGTMTWVFIILLLVLTLPGS